MATDVLTNFTQTTKLINTQKPKSKGIIEYHSKVYVHAPENVPKPTNTLNTELHIPVIDLKNMNNPNRRSEIIKEISKASKSWGVFQLINHSMPTSVLDGMAESVKKFHEKEQESKAKYSSDNFRDTLSCFFDEPLNPEDLPEICRETLLEYRKQITSVASTLSHILSEALGRKTNYFESMNCTKAQLLVAHYYPPSPQPEQTIEIPKHSDPNFFTLSLQDSLGSLQVIHQDQWVPVPPIRGALVVILGGLLQLMSNSEFKTVEHRWYAKIRVPRLSVAVFFSPGRDEETTIGPVKETLSDENGAKYQDIFFREFNYYKTKGLNGESGLNDIKA